MAKKNNYKFEFQSVYLFFGAIILLLCACSCLCITCFKMKKELNSNAISSLESTELEAFHYLVRVYVAQCPHLEPRGPVVSEVQRDYTKTNACELLDYDINPEGKLEISFKYQPWDNETWEIAGEQKSARVVFHELDNLFNGHKEYREELILE